MADRDPYELPPGQMSPHVHRLIVTNRTGADLYVSVRQAGG
ncbi:hypothetical protein [Frankia umida]|nr:hypothetical protein [Frankia umida]